MSGLDEIDKAFRGKWGVIFFLACIAWSSWIISFYRILFGRGMGMGQPPKEAWRKMDLDLLEGEWCNGPELPPFTHLSLTEYGARR
jgi:hypothetical protein